MCVQVNDFRHDVWGFGITILTIPAGLVRNTNGVPSGQCKIKFRLSPKPITEERD